MPTAAGNLPIPPQPAAFMLLLLLVAAGGQPGYARDAESASPGDKQRRGEILFVRQVLPLFQRKCLACHGNDPQDLKGEFDMRSRGGLLRGGESGKASIVPGRPDDSVLYEAVRWEGLEMPPKENDRLNATEIDAVRRWIEMGAVWPGAQRLKQLRDQAWSADSNDAVPVRTTGGTTTQWTNRRYAPEDLWAYQPLAGAEVPWQASGLAEGANPIDAFIHRKLKAAGITPAPRADALTLIRRLTFSLTGLPPTPQEIDRFSEDSSPAAFAKSVDRLLDSKHYGEQMARHWLDVVRYADSAGFSNDFSRPSAWRYRDYVIRSFNGDKPFDEFVREQLAGDEIDPTDPEHLIAVGFLRMGPWEHTAMSVAAVTRQQYLDDVVQSVGQTFLATGLRCFKCHDHKFDPMPTKDYYRMQAIFAPLQFADRNVPFQSTENTRGIAEGMERIERLIRAPGVKLIVPDGATQQQINESQLGVRKVEKKQGQIYRRLLNRYKPLALSVYNGPPNIYRSNQPLHPMPKARQGKVQEIFVLTGGALDSPTEKVTPGVLSAVYGSNDQIGRDDWNGIPPTMNGRRTALANWIASERNPLTARVVVNRIWQWHFGLGLAANPNNFGKMGGKPTHPELLDWLAQWFMKHQWSVKALNRLIVTSQTYQRRADPVAPEQIAQRDPDNRLLSCYPTRRLAAEELRDAMLAASGELNRQLGGIPVRPEINRDVAMQPRHVMGSVAPAYQPSRTPGERNRRTIYALKIRTLRDPMLEVFDQPGSDLSCERRTQSTITPQVFSLFNAETSYKRALAMADRLTKSHNQHDGRIKRAYQLAFGRLPSRRELELSMQHVARMTRYHQRQPPIERVIPRTVVRTMVEEMTGLTFRWEEQLDVYQKYVDDIHPRDVAPETRALADLCLVLFNANEFVYVY